MAAKPTQQTILNTHQNTSFHTKQNDELFHCVVNERIRQTKLSANQAHWSFSATIIMTTNSALIGLIGAILVLLGRASEGSVTAAAGIASGIYSYQLSKEAADRQEQANIRLDKMLLILQEDQPD
ncbi:MAG: hypothetical protein AAGH78_00580 [Cyanobacteria bacterium P01_H01_bin.58]